MKRLMVFALAALVFFSLGCSKFEKPSAPDVPELGSITARVLFDNNPLAGVKVHFSGSDYRLVQTGQDGYAKADSLSAGMYNVLIEGFGDSVYFTATQKSVKLEEGGNVPVVFSGTAVIPHQIPSITGRVTVGVAGLVDVLVCLSGDASTYTKTDCGGYYKFENLELGDYVVTLNADTNLYIFPELAHSISVVGYGEFVHNFVGELKPVLPTKGIVTVQVLNGTNPLSGVTVHLYGQDSRTITTGQNGFAISDSLSAGAYTVRISGYGDDVTFSETEKSVTVSAGGNTPVVFSGTAVVHQTSKIYGRVSADGFGMSYIFVSLSGTSSDSVRTDQGGNYSFTVGVGEYIVSMLNPDPTAYSFATLSQSVAIMGNGVFGVNFEGTRIEPDTFIISGEVSADGYDIPNVRVVLSGVLADTAVTDAGGNYEFSGLGPGEYFVSIANPDPERYEFDSLSKSVFINSADEFGVDFEGTLKAEPPKKGSITVKTFVGGVPLPGVNVDVAGNTLLTGQSGVAVFGDLSPGTYSVSISGFGAYVDFSETHKTVIVGEGENKNVSFYGVEVVVNQTGTINGRVTVDGAGLGDVKVFVGGRSDTTDANGNYTISGLQSGEHTVSIVNPDTSKYEFNSLSQSVYLAAGATVSANFSGEEKEIVQPTPEKAAIIGVVYEDVNRNGYYDAEDNVFAEKTVTLSAFGGSKSVVTGSNGRYTFDGLDRIGSYDVTFVNPNTSVYRFDSEKDGSVTSNAYIGYVEGTRMSVDFRAVRK